MSEQARPEGGPAQTENVRTETETETVGTETVETETVGTETAETGTVETGIPAAGDGPGDDQEVSRFGVPGRPVNPGHPFYVGFTGALGVLVAYGLLQSLTQLSGVLTLLLIALFLALGLDPVVAALQRRGLGRGWAVAVVVLGVIAVFAGFVAAVVPTLVSQGGDFATQLPDLVKRLQTSSSVQWLDHRFGLVSNLTDQLQKWVTNKDTVLSLFGGVFGAGKAVVSGAFSTFTVLVLTLYFLASKPSMTEAAYRLVPASRRQRVRLLGDEILRRIGSYIAGQVAVAAINAALTYVMLTILGIDYALVLAIAVGLLGLIPMVGATLGAVVVVLVALFNSWQLAVIALVYYLIYQQVENYVISPRIMSRAVSVPGSVAMIAALAGGTLLGILGALVAIPVAAGILLILEEVVAPRQAQH